MNAQTPGEDFVPSRPYPVEAADAAPAAPPPPARRGVFSRYVLPVALFVAIVGLTAWVTQFMPNWRARTAAKTPSDQGDAFKATPVLQFVRVAAQWDPADESYVRAYERGEAGHYDFPFQNTAESEADLGLESRSCDCSSIEACTLSAYDWERVVAADPTQPLPVREPAWQTLEPSQDKGITIPPKGRGLVRVTWKSSKDAGRLNLKPKIWSEPHGEPAKRTSVKLEVPTFTVPPYLLENEKVSLSTLVKNAVGKAEFDAYSLTRDQLDLQAEPSPLYEVEIAPLDKVGLAALQQRLKAASHESRARCGRHIIVTVREEKNGKEMDLGPFLYTVKLQVDGLPAPGALPVVYGRVKGEVEVGGTDDNGRIDLRTFKVRDGTLQKVPVWADEKAALELQDQQPATLEVKLQKDAKQVSAGRTKWILELNFPPDLPSGPLPEASAVILRIAGPNPRLVRIPITGIAISD